MPESHELAWCTKGARCWLASWGCARQTASVCAILENVNVPEKILVCIKS